MKIQLINSVSALLLFGSVSITNISAQYERVAFPVPDFSDNPNVERSLTVSLENAYKAMQRHLCSLDGNPSPEWKTKYRQLLIDLIGLQHEVIIADAGDLVGSGGERDEIATFFQEHEHIKRILKQEIGASNDANDKAFYRDLLETYSKRLNEINNSAAQDKYGRGGRQIFALGTLVVELKDSLGVRQMKNRTAIDARIQRSFEALSRAYDYLIFRGTTHLNNVRLKNRSDFPLVPISPLESDPYLHDWGKYGEVEGAIARGLSTNGQNFSGFWLNMPEGSAFDLETQKKVRGGCRKIDNQIASNNSISSNSRFQGIYKNPNGELLGVKMEGNQIKIGTVKKIGNSDQYEWLFIRQRGSGGEGWFYLQNVIRTEDLGNEYIAYTQYEYRIVCQKDGKQYELPKNLPIIRYIFSHDGSAFRTQTKLGEKRPECNKEITSIIQDDWLEARDPYIRRATGVRISHQIP